MTCQLIHPQKENENKAEKALLDFLKNLPEEYYCYRELRITPLNKDIMKGIKKKKPDFIVVGKKSGLMAIEVKYWDLDTNNYEWLNQEEIKVTQPNGNIKKIKNPRKQANNYLYALMELREDIRIWVQSILAFPLNSKQSFLNKLQNIEVLQNEQSKYYVDLNRTIFREDIEKYINNPEALIEKIARQDPGFRVPKSKALRKITNRLLPPTFKIGDYRQREENYRQINIISEKQKEWIFDLDSEKNHLLDVAGSGKTNVLISKAIHLVDIAENHNIPQILLTTYNENLEKNIKGILKHKVGKEHSNQKYYQAITVKSIPSLMEEIIKDYYDLTDLSEYKKDGTSQKESEDKFRKDTIDILGSEPEDYQKYDHIFIDEIQDFDDQYLYIVKKLCKKSNYFFVGDIGQKIYDRTYHLNKLGLVPQEIKFPKSFQMYRTPKYIGELATKFIFYNPHLKHELEKYGFDEQFKYPNKLNSAAEIKQSSEPEQEIINQIEDLLTKTYVENNIMLITSNKNIDTFREKLSNTSIDFSIGESEDENSVVLVDFMNVKGLEKEVVFVNCIEDLYNRNKDEQLFLEEDKKIVKEILSRRKIYVSLTRALERLIIFYQNNHNVFISELLEINDKIYNKRIKN